MVFHLISSAYMKKNHSQFNLGISKNFGQLNKKHCSMFHHRITNNLRHIEYMTLATI
jgi:phage gp16-like protein